MSVWGDPGWGDDGREPRPPISEVIRDLWDRAWLGPVRLDLFGCALLGLTAGLLAAVSYQLVTGRPL